MLNNLKVIRIDHKFDGIIKDGDNIIKVPFTQKDDIIQIKSLNNSKEIPIALDYSFVSKSQNRIKPICTYYESCGGCKAQHLPSEEYIAIKKNHFQQACEFLNLKDIEFKHHLDSPIKQRRRATFSVKNNNIGFKEYRSNKVVSINHCPLLTDAINIFFKDLSQIIKTSNQILGITEVIISDINGKIDVLIKSNNGTNAKILSILMPLFVKSLAKSIHWQAPNKKPEALAIQEQIFLNYNNHLIPFATGSFLQAEAFGEETLQKAVLQNLINPQKVLDLFCGLGGYSFNIAHVPSITNIQAVDSNKEAISAIKAVKNPKIQAFAKDIIKTPYLAQELENFDTIIINPPRVGAKEQAKEIAKCTNINQISMIYCSVSALARDLQIILQSNNFMINSIFIVDQFIYTEHMEIYVSLQNKTLNN
jgi:23S rRNA (uracil1939-C5)-methyltransferase